MTGSRREIEVKLQFDSPIRARESVRRLGAKLLQKRHFEDNVLFDVEGDRLRRSGRMLRLRRTDHGAWLTFKAPVSGSHRHKVRREEEVVVDDPDAARRILLGLGFLPRYRYQKYRTLFGLGDLRLCLDETPIGCFLELEGPPDAIDGAARRMGLGDGSYLAETYRELHERHAREHGVKAGDLVFGRRAERAGR